MATTAPAREGSRRRSSLPPLLLLLCVLLVLLAAAAGESLDADAKITVTTTDGREQELSAAEFEALARERHEQQGELQREPREEWTRDQTTEAVARDDPALARLISVARRAFGALQRRGFAPESYALAGFSEREERQSQGEPAREGELRVALELQTAPKEGGRAKTLAFEVDVLLDADLRVWLLAAWELDGPGGRRAQALRVDGEDAPRARERTQRVRLLLLGGGVVLIAGGALVLYGSRPPAWAAAKARADAAAKARKGTGRSAARKATAERAQQRWALDDKKAQ